MPVEIEDRFKSKRILQITVMERPSDYLVFYYHDPRLWANGKTEAEAIGNLILNRAEALRGRVRIITLDAKNINTWK